MSNTITTTKHDIKIVETSTTGGVTTTIVITDGGQNLPSASDEVVCDGTISIPTEPGSDGILAEARFGSRVSVMGRELGEMWGFARSMDSVRFVTFNVKARTYAAARSQALEFARREVGKLHEALRVRAEAFLAAQ